MKNGLSFGFSREKEGQEDAKESLVWNMYFENANPNPTVSALGKEDSHTSYFIGNNPAKHKTNVPDYRYIKYENIYPNVDLQYYGKSKALEYDFILKPGADIRNIQLRFDGVKNLSINQNQMLEIETPWGILQEHIPTSYQLVNGKKVEIPVSYELSKNKALTFKINGNYDPNLPLVIDPVNLKWSTYVGPTTNTGDGYLYSMDVDANENVYVTGYFNDQFPTTPGVYDNTFNSPMGIKKMDIIVYKLKTDGSDLIYATYIGGNNQEMGLSIKANNIGEVFIGGLTYSTNFPTTPGAYKKIKTTDTTMAEVFCLKLNSTGSSIKYSSFIGCNFNATSVIATSLRQLPHGMSLAINTSNEVYICANTDSATFTPSSTAYDSTYNGGTTDAVLVKLDSTGSTAIIATYIGGSGIDYPMDIELDNKNNIYITGTTTSNNFPITNGAFSDSLAGNYDVFVLKLNPTATNLIYSTFIGGSGIDYSRAMAITKNEEVVIAGVSTSTNYPTSPFAFKKTNTSPSSAGVISKLNVFGNALITSTYFGVTFQNIITDIKLNADEAVYIAGYTSSPIFPVTACAFQMQFSTGSYFDFFISKLNADLSSLAYSSYMGGNSFDYRQPNIFIIPNNCGNNDIILGGTTHSTNLPTTSGAYLTQNNNYMTSDQDIHVLTRFTPPNPIVDFNYTIDTIGLSINFSNTTSDNCLGSGYIWDFGDSTSSTQENPVHNYANAGTYTVTLSTTCQSSISKTISIPIFSGINNLLKKEDYQIIPNPFNNSLSIHTTKTGAIQFELCDVMGRSLIKKTTFPINGSIQIDQLGELVFGVYFIKINQVYEKPFIRKLIKQ